MSKDKFTIELQGMFLETAVSDCKRAMAQLQLPLQNDLNEWYKGRLSVWELLLEWYQKENNK